jgi:transposase
MLDETIITETPPLSHAYGHIGEQKLVLITGNRAKRILHGALNIKSGDIELLITDVWDQFTHQCFLKQIRSYWRGWNIVLFQDRGSPHTAEASKELAKEIGIEIRFLPVATPKLNSMDHIWRFVKKNTQANRARMKIDDAAMFASQYLLRMSRQERLKKAGVLSENFWLASIIN